MASGTRTRAQSAMEYLMTYGWAILIIAVVIGVLYQLGVFGGANTSTNSCLASPGFNCSGITLYGNGTLSFTFGVVSSQTQMIGGIGCSSNATIPPSTPIIPALVLSSGGKAEVNTTCPLMSSNLGQKFTGYLWAWLPDPTNIGAFDPTKIATLQAVVTNPGTAVATGGTPASEADYGEDDSTGTLSVTTKGIYNLYICVAAAGVGDGNPDGGIYSFNYRGIAGDPQPFTAIGISGSNSMCSMTGDDGLAMGLLGLSGQPAYQTPVPTVVDAGVNGFANVSFTVSGSNNYVVLTAACGGFDCGSGSSGSVTVDPAISSSCTNQVDEEAMDNYETAFITTCQITAPGTYWFNASQGQWLPSGISAAAFVFPNYTP